jgi:hypothetical protein
VTHEPEGSGWDDVGQAEVGEGVGGEEGGDLFDLGAAQGAPRQVADGGYAARRWERFPRLTRRRSKPTRRQRVRAIATSAGSGGAN